MTAPSYSAYPAMTGTGYVGEALTCTSGTWSNTTSFNYQWQSSATSDFSSFTALRSTGYVSATSDSYTPVAADAHRNVRCVVTGQNADGTATPPAPVKYVSYRPPQSTAAPTFGGTIAVGSLVTLSSGSWSGDTSGGYTYYFSIADDSGNYDIESSGGTSSNSFTIPATVYDNNSGDDVSTIGLNLVGTVFAHASTGEQGAASTDEVGPITAAVTTVSALSSTKKVSTSALTASGAALTGSAATRRATAAATVREGARLTTAGATKKTTASGTVRKGAKATVAAATKKGTATVAAKEGERATIAASTKKVIASATVGATILASPGASSSGSNFNGGSLQVSAAPPTGLVNGDVILAAYATLSPVGDNSTPVAPSGFTAVPDGYRDDPALGGNYTDRLTVFVHPVTDAAEPASYSFNAEQTSSSGFSFAYLLMLRISGADASNLLSAVSTTQASADGQQPSAATLPSITTNDTNTLIVSVGWTLPGYAASASQWAKGAPSGTSIAAAINDDQNYVNLGIVTRQLLAAGSSGALTTTTPSTANAPFQAVTLAVRSKSSVSTGMAAAVAANTKKIASAAALAEGESVSVAASTKKPSALAATAHGRSVQVAGSTGKVQGSAQASGGAALTATGNTQKTIGGASASYVAQSSATVAGATRKLQAAGQASIGAAGAGSSATKKLTPQATMVEGAGLAVAASTRRVTAQASVADGEASGGAGATKRVTASAQATVGTNLSGSAATTKLTAQAAVASGVGLTGDATTRKLTASASTVSAPPGTTVIALTRKVIAQAAASEGAGVSIFSGTKKVEASGSAEVVDLVSIIAATRKVSAQATIGEGESATTAASTRKVQGAAQTVVGEALEGQGATKRLTATGVACDGAAVSGACATRKSTGSASTAVGLRADITAATPKVGGVAQLVEIVGVAVIVTGATRKLAGHGVALTHDLAVEAKSAVRIGAEDRAVSVAPGVRRLNIREDVRSVRIAA